VDWRIALPLVLAVLALAACGDNGNDRPEQPARTSAELASQPPRGTPAEQRRLRRDQRPVTRPLEQGDARPQVERLITAEARRRVRARRLDGPVRRTKCEAPVEIEGGMLALDCVAVTTEGPGGAVLGHPFVAAVSADGGSVTFCRRRLGAGEGGSLSDAFVPLEPPCAQAARAH
jgi:hypothetical protein